MKNKIGLGGGCHWCTEGVLSSLIGVKEVKQGWIASSGKYRDFSEAVIVYFDPQIITETDLMQIHIATHASSSDHSLRTKYRSAIYTFDSAQNERIDIILKGFEKQHDIKLITMTLPMIEFKLNQEKYLDYLLKNSDSQFCQRYIHPKLVLVDKKFGKLKKERLTLINKKNNELKYNRDTRCVE